MHRPHTGCKTTKLPPGKAVLVGNWSMDNAFQLMMKTQAVACYCRYSRCHFVLFLKLIPLCRASEKCSFNSYFLVNYYSISTSHTPLRTDTYTLPGSQMFLKIQACQIKLSTSIFTETTETNELHKKTNNQNQFTH